MNNSFSVLAHTNGEVINRHTYNTNSKIQGEENLMKKRLVQTLLFSTIVCLSTFHSSPVLGEDYHIQTDVAVQEETTNLIAGITKVMIEYTHELSVDNEEYTGYLTSNMNVRSEPSTDSEILEVYPFNQKIQYQKYNDEWVEIQYKSGIAYIFSEYISDGQLDYIEYIVPITSGFKSYMPYTTITSKSSQQYKLQKIAYTGTYGIRQYDNRYCVAIGTAFNADVGTYFDLILANGTVIPCIVADIKADRHTDSNNMVTIANGCLTEFIVDSSTLNRKAKRMGDISYCNEDWNSRVEKIRVYDKNVFRKE